MRGLVLLAAVLYYTSAGAVEYKCRDANGNWTALACMVVVPLQETQYMRDRRLRAEADAARRTARYRLSPYCFRLDRNASVYDCVDLQMRAYDDVTRLRSAAGASSPQAAVLAECLERHFDPATRATDYRLVRECVLTR
jgi:hypothetical protein